MGGFKLYCAEWNRKRQILYNFMYMWNLTKQTELNRYREPTGGYQRGEGGFI